MKTKLASDLFSGLTNKMNKVYNSWLRHYLCLARSQTVLNKSRATLTPWWRGERFVSGNTFVPPFCNSDWLKSVLQTFYWLRLMSLLSPWFGVPHARGGMKIDKKRGPGKELLPLVKRKKTEGGLCYGRNPKDGDFCRLRHKQTRWS